MLCVRALVDLLEAGITKAGGKEEAKEYMENNLMGGSNIRQNMWQEVASRDYDGGVQEAMYSAIFHPCLSTIELVSEGGVAWARGDLPNMNSSLLLKVKSFFVTTTISLRYQRNIFLPQHRKIRTATMENSSITYSCFPKVCTPSPK